MKKRGRPQREYTENEKLEIKKVYKKACNHKDKGRLLCIKLRVVNGLSLEQISSITEYSLSAVSHVISLYNRYGINKILVKKYGGNHRNMTPEEEKEFLEPFRQKVLAGEILEVNKIITAYSNKLNKKVSKSTVYDLLHRNGWIKIPSTSKYLNKSDHKSIETYKKNAWKSK